MPKVTLKNINRVEVEAHGWRVHIKRRRRAYVQYFPDGMDGPFESLRAAIGYRDRLWRELGPPTHVPVKATRRSTSGVVGVHHEVQQIASGRVVENWVAAWTTADGGRQRRAFSLDKWGNQEARRMAVEARAAGVRETARARQKKLLDVLHTHRVLTDRSGLGTSMP